MLDSETALKKQVFNNFMSCQNKDHETVEDTFLQDFTHKDKNEHSKVSVALAPGIESYHQGLISLPEREALIFILSDIFSFGQM